MNKNFGTLGEINNILNDDKSINNITNLNLTNKINDKNDILKE